jgi:hypothetical protein
MIQIWVALKSICVLHAQRNLIFERFVKRARDPKMSDSVVNEKKVVSRTVAIALGILCIFLIAWIGGTIAYFSMMVNNNDNTISSQASQISNLQNQVSDLNSSLNLNKSIVWISSQTVSSPYNSYYSWVPLRVPCAGYVSVTVESSTSNSTYVHVIYSAYGVNYDQWRAVDAGGTFVFPVLPTSSLGVYVGAGAVSLTVTVTITYYY